MGLGLLHGYIVWLCFGKKNAGCLGVVRFGFPRRFCLSFSFFPPSSSSCFSWGRPGFSFVSFLCSDCRTDPRMPGNYLGALCTKIQGITALLSASCAKFLGIAAFLDASCTKSSGTTAFLGAECTELLGFTAFLGASCTKFLGTGALLSAQCTQFLGITAFLGAS